MRFRIESGTDQSSAPLVLCLHGQGMNEEWFALLLQKLFVLPAHFVIPRAAIAMTAEGTGKPGASWYDYDGDQDRFLRELARVEAELLRFLSDVERDHQLEPRHRVLFGFSQGGYAAGYIALRHPDIFDGLIVSGARVKTESLWGSDVPSSAQLASARTADGGPMKVLLCHGRRDRMVLPEAAERSHRELETRGLAVTTETFGAGHVINREQIAAIATWLRLSFL